MCFTIFQNEKTPFQAIKTRSSKSQKIDNFPMVLTHGFGPKIPIFPTFFSQVIQATKMCFTIFQNKKTPFQAINTSGSKSRKIDNFAMVLTHGFGPKIPIFPTFFFQAIQTRKMSFTIFQNEKTPLQARKTRTSNCRKIDIFSWFWSKNGHFSNFFQAIQSWKMFFMIFQKEKTPFQAINTRSSKP